MNAATEEVLADDEAEALAKMSPGELLEELRDVRDERRKIAKRDKELIELYRVIEAQLIAMCDNMRMKRMSTDTVTGTVTEEVLPQLDDFDELWEYMKENDAPHLLQRRVAAGAYRELQDAGVDVPGISPYVQRKISLRQK